MKMIKLHLVMIAFLMSMLMGVTVSEAQEQAIPQQLSTISLQVTSIGQALSPIKQQISTINNNVAPFVSLLPNIIAPDQSDVRFTPPVTPTAGAHGISCFVTNVSSGDLAVQVTLFSTSLLNVTSVVADGVLIPSPGSVGRLQSNVSPVGEAFYCRFIVGVGVSLPGSRTAIRASIQSTLLPTEVGVGASIEAILAAE